MPETTEKKKKGRTSTFSQHIANVICIRIAEGESLRKIIKDDDMPSQSVIYEWLIRHPSFAEQYARAREEQADTLADEIISIADETPETQPVYDKNGELIEVKMDNAYIQWQRNRVDARKWTAMKLKPKKYGDKIALAGDAENPLKIDATVEAGETFAAILQNLELKKQADE